MFFFCRKWDCMVGLPLFPLTMFVHPSTMDDTLWKVRSIDFLCDRLWEARFLGIFSVEFWNAMSIDVSYVDGGFQDATSPLFLVAHSRAFEALRGKFWTNKLMVGQCCKINLWCVNFVCALSLWLQSHATFSSPTIK
jgi:hypothetical protein